MPLGSSRGMWGLILALASTALVGAQQGPVFTSGQNVAVAYEGWEQNPDGSFNLVFGYLNRNRDEEMSVPIGPDNNIEPGGPDQGQPTRFLPHRNRFVFSIRVPKDFGNKEIVWTLTSRGKTEKAYATLKPDYFIDSSVVMMNFSRGVGDNELLTKNQAPRLKLEGSKALKTTVGQPVTLVAVATDDELPRRRDLPPVNPSVGQGVATAAAQGLRLAWVVYRGSGPVTFDPPQFKVQEDMRGGSPWAPGWVTPPIPPKNTWITKATFSEPGSYVLRCLAHDGALQTYEHITIDVTK